VLAISIFPDIAPVAILLELTAPLPNFGPVIEPSAISAAITVPSAMTAAVIVFDAIESTVILLSAICYSFSFIYFIK
jgi:hypothetical protein